MESEHLKRNQAAHFLSRARERIGLNLTMVDVDALSARVKKKISPKNTLAIQADGKQIVIANLGRHGQHPCVFDPKTDTLVTILDWSMVDGWRKLLEKRNRKRRLKQHAKTTSLRAGPA